MTITATIAGAISMVAQFGMFFGGNRDNNHGPGIIGSIAMMILAPLGAMLVQTAISRTREYAADDLGARIVGQPMWLASALLKIENAAHAVPNMQAERNPATAHMFIINPLTGHGIDSLFSTHPSTENRIAELQRLVTALRHVRGPVVVVSNEVGSAIVPDNALAREFRDAAGTLNQWVAAVADEVTLAVAGLPLKVK